MYLTFDAVAFDVLTLAEVVLEESSRAWYVESGPSAVTVTEYTVVKLLAYVIFDSVLLAAAEPHTNLRPFGRNVYPLAATFELPSLSPVFDVTFAPAVVTKAGVIDTAPEVFEIVTEEVLATTFAVELPWAKEPVPIVVDWVLFETTREDVVNTLFVVDVPTKRPVVLAVTSEPNESAFIEALFASARISSTPPAVEPS